LDSSFGEQLLVATLGRSFREPLCRMALGSRFGELGATALENSFGAQLWGAPGNSFGEQLWAAFRTSFEAASGSSFGVLRSFFGTRLSAAILKSSFGEQLWGALRLCSNIDEQLL